MAQTATKPKIYITEKAATQVKKLSSTESGAEAGLRVAVQGGGCSGLTYKLSFELDEHQGDNVFQEHGVKLLVDGKSLLFLIGTELDFSDGLNGKGFTFANPNAKATCGCGTSFSA